ncbi:hypothetical protein F1880_010114 [Penicillium rolfsii]|nr:hypothetical protein F1880_010114 [Penicillium rolfsii]
MYKHSYRDLISNLPVSRADLDFFGDMPLLRPYMENSSPYQPVPFVTRYDKGNMSDRFFNKTINSSDTIPRVVAFMRKPSPPYDTQNVREDKDPSQCLEEPHFVAICQLEGGVNGYINTAHGGVLAALLDETLGLCAESYRLFTPDEREPLLTASLEMSFRSPVPTPSVIIIKSWVRRKVDRKWFLEAQILDQNGSLKVEAKSLYIKLAAAL